MRNVSGADRLFELSYGVDVTVDPMNGRVHAAARRYERNGDRRRWWSVVYGFDREGAVVAIEEPVSSHDDGTVRGEYALHAYRTGQ